MSDQRLEELLTAYLSRQITDGEQEELRLLLASSDDEQLQESLASVWDRYESPHDLSDHRSEDILAEIFRPKVVSLTKPRHGWWWVAASVAVLMGLGLVFWHSRQSAAIPSRKVAAVIHDVPAPQTNHATVTLSNGRIVYLDSAGNGALAQQAGVTLAKTGEGKIRYAATRSDNSPEEKELVYNTLNNPRGSKVINITLSDGSHVWLDAGSSLTYPVAFNGKQRRVSIRGQAYFEIAHNAAQPFIVSKDNVDITVLGTHFNVDAFGSEDAMLVTLLEGKVRVATETGHGQVTQAITLHPGEQAVYKNLTASQLSVKSDVDLAEVMAWKNGRFQFNRTNITRIASQIERWYDVDVEVNDTVKQMDFSGGIARTENVSGVLKMLQMTGAIHFEIEGKKIIIKK